MNPRHSSRLRVAAAAACIAIVAGCGGTDRGTGSAATADATAPAADTAGVASLPVLVPVTGPQVRERVREPGARATLVNVWATWCAPCREEFPDLVKLADAHREDGLRVLFVSADFDDQEAAVRRFLAKHRAPEPWLFKTGKDMEFIDGLDPRWSGALPVTIVYDGNGNPVEFWEGRADYARLESAVAPLLAASTTR
jgi:thiol-disulfide isomerase/thioredoxin